MNSEIGTSFNFCKLFCSLVMCSSISVRFSALFASSPLILVSALSIPSNSRMMSRSVFVLTEFITSLMTSSSLRGGSSISMSTSLSQTRARDLLYEAVSIPSNIRASDAPKRVHMVLLAKNSPLEVDILAYSPGDFST